MSAVEKMTSEEISNLVIKIVSENLNISKDLIKPSSHFINDLGADSLDTMELVMAFEDNFRCQINDDQASKIQTVQDAINHFELHAGAANNTLAG